MAMRPLHHVPREDPDLPRGDLILHFSRRPESTPAGVRETAVGGGGEGGAGQTPDGCGKLLEERAIRGNADGDDPFFFFSWPWYREQVHSPGSPGDLQEVADRANKSNRREIALTSETKMELANKKTAHGCWWVFFSTHCQKWTRGKPQFSELTLQSSHYLPRA